eukprot:Sspe_Gene.74490::Locus_46259_Transcript_3_6_Confidence_0.667_Length_818::g.74490::m.74490
MMCAVLAPHTPGQPQPLEHALGGDKAIPSIPSTRLSGMVVHRPPRAAEGPLQGPTIVLREVSRYRQNRVAMMQKRMAAISDHERLLAQSIERVSYREPLALMSGFLASASLNSHRTLLERRGAA